MEPVNVPVGEARSARVLGNIVGEVKVETEGRAVTASWDPLTRTVHLIGRETGQTTVTVSDAKSSLTVPVQVAKYAMQLDEPVTATVTGSPPSQFATESAVAAAVQSAIHPEPGANCDIYTEECNVDNLQPGCTTRVPVRIIAEGSGYLPYRGRPAVTVMNRSVTLSPVSLLMVSNSPEKLRGMACGTKRCCRIGRARDCCITT